MLEKGFGRERNYIRALEGWMEFLPSTSPHHSTAKWRLKHQKISACGSTPPYEGLLTRTRLPFPEGKQQFGILKWSTSHQYKRDFVTLFFSLYHWDEKEPDVLVKTKCSYFPYGRYLVNRLRGHSGHWWATKVMRVLADWKLDRNKNSTSSRKINILRMSMIFRFSIHSTPTTFHSVSKVQILNHVLFQGSIPLPASPSRFRFSSWKARGTCLSWHPRIWCPWDNRFSWVRFCRDRCQPDLELSLRINGWSYQLPRLWRPKLVWFNQLCELCYSGH